MKAYIMTILAAAVTVSVTGCLLPEGTVKKYASLASSVMISLAVALPFAGLFGKDFEFSLPDTEEFIYSYDAETEYKKMLADEYEKEIEEKLSYLGRIYAKVDADFNVEKIEIYLSNEIGEEEKKKITDEYSPLVLEVHYGGT